MIKIFSSEHVRKWDQFTIKNEPIESVDLMERAANAFVKQFLELNPDKRPVRIFCGIGNNGGDGLAIGRILQEKGWEVFIYIIGDPRKGSNDFKSNLNRSHLYAVIEKEEDLPEVLKGELIIDALFGSGLSRPLAGLYSEVVRYINQSSANTISVDIASGLFLDQPVVERLCIIEPRYTISFQIPKLPFFLPESYPYVGEWFIVDIGLDETFVKKEKTDFVLTEKSDLLNLIPRRKKFTHKSEAGRLLLVSGSKGKIGAAVLCTRAAFAAGARLINVCSPSCGTAILQQSIPEAMVIEDSHEEFITKIPKSDDPVAIGPGLGTNEKTIKAFETLLKNTNRPMVIDADAINILSKKKAFLKLLPQESILTPHPGEFKRLVGVWKNDFEKLEKLQKFCLKFQLNVLLKGAYSAVCSSKGKVFFNPTGNPVLATAGSGDVLTGIIGALVAQGIVPIDALKLGVFLHGKTGDVLVKDSKKSSIIASEIVEHLPALVTEFLAR